MNKTDLQNQISQFIIRDQKDLAFDYLEIYKREFGKDVFYYLSYSDLLIQIEDYETVIQIMEEALGHHMHNSLIKERLADGYFGKNQFKKAQMIYQQCDINADDPSALHIRYMLGLCAMKLQQYPQAISYFEDVLLDQSQNKKALYYCGIAYGLENREHLCKEYLKRYIQLEPKGIYDVCEKFLWLKKLDLAFEFIQQIHDPCRQKEYLIQYHISKDDVSQAIAIAEALYKEVPNLRHLDELASLYDRNKAYDQANQLYDTLIHMPDDDSLSMLQSIQFHLSAYQRTQNRNYKKYILMHLQDAKKDMDIFLYIFHFAQVMQDMELSEWFIDQKPFFHDIRQEQEYYRLVMRYYLRTHKYEEGFKYLQTMDPESFEDYYKLRVVFEFYLCQFDQVFQHYQMAMPNGLVAYMAFVSMGLLHKEGEATDFLAHFMDYANENPDTEDLDIFYELLEDIQKNRSHS
ncbi:tetratricopeptide repeat protein [Absicoccus intestinalis]|uniref:Tetratricopeptide repeat protein n=1 Tax=Absicoccus intestinalis TaxID=2926319 RepID=A0ABU4WP93_9FIRM|nr:tetratricopeptide repeat protein [Absicoccus sp. CLA-KB-P134]MDX8418387.1 hypothetical protein [Absicoccus sp. CLA-KB-P134]